MVLYPPGILVPIPYANIPISFAFPIFHSFLLLPFNSARILSMPPVVGLISAPTNSVASVMVKG